MCVFRRISGYFRLNKLAKKLKKESLKINANFHFFENIQLSENILFCVNELREQKKYIDLVNSFDETVKKINRHNLKICDLKNQFDDIVKNHNIQKIISHIDEYSLEQIRSYNQIVLEIGEYTIPDSFTEKSQYLRYMRDIGEILNDYAKIAEQYSLIKDFEAISYSFGDTYIDGEMERSILAPAKNILEKIKTFGSKYYNIPQLDDKIIERHNEQFIKNHLRESLFDDINGKSLGEEQRRAILCDAKSNLTIAGAGTGKTLTICGKVKWLLETKKAREDEILLLSYSKDSATDLADRIKPINANLKVKTFHSFGLEILNRAYGGKRAVENQLDAHIRRYFNEELSKNSEAANAVFRYFTLYLYTNNELKHYKTDGEKFEDLKTADFRTLKDKLKLLSNDIERYETIQNEYVKSYEELVIANFLFINGINYEYERTYKIDTATLEKRQYTPDFYLTDYDIYLEHYGIDENEKTPQYSLEEGTKYIESIQWKRQIHRQNRTVCIETYSYEFKNGAIFSNLQKRLKQYNVEFKPLGQTEILDALNKIYLGQEFVSLLNLISTFLSLYKSQYSDSESFELLKSRPLGSEYNNQRAKLFLDICKGIYEYYIKALRSENKIDFDDMILQSMHAIDKMGDYRYKYIIVDEFQDISQSRTRFLQKIIEHGDSKLFAAGDDWQAIYRFTGCDIGVFLNFSQYFKDAKLNYITITHRNSAELQAVVEPFITANPEQYKKHIQSNKHQDLPVRIIYHNNNRAAAFKKVLQNIAKTDPRASVLVLGRNRNDIKCIIENYGRIDKSGKLYFDEFSQMSLTYKTVHQSKGLECDFVILISGENAKNGFPNKMEDDRLLDLVLVDKSNYEYAEERRLFYVALTRTRSIVYILSDKNKPSVFVQEIEDRVKIENLELFFKEMPDDVLCPYCESGKLVLHKGKDGKSFYGCSNFPYCRYTINDLKAVFINNRCPDCGDFLVVRNGKNGKFIGCHSFPYCKYTRQLNDMKERNTTGF